MLLLCRKAFAVCLVLFFVSEIRSQNYWRILDRPTTRNLSELYFLDSLRGWVVGDSGTILKTTNGGQSWIPQNSNTLFKMFDIFMLDENYGWALAHNYEWGDTTYGTTMLRTVNGGDNWSTRIYRDEFFTTLVFFDSLSGLMAGAFGTIMRTTDGGQIWLHTTVDSSAVWGYPILQVRFFSRTYGLGVGGWIDINGGVWKTTNGGLHWTSMAVSPEPIHDIHFIDSSNIIGVGGDFDFGSGMVRSTDAGETWTYTFLGIWGEARTLAFRTPAEAWVPLGFAGTYMYTLDTGQTWTDVYTPDSTAILDAVFVDSLTGYMVGERGTILKYSRGPVNVTTDSFTTVPTTTMLFQNYPNPFNSQTVIRFQVPVSGFVTLKVYNFLGQEVATLVRDMKHPGRHEVIWDASANPSGVYFARLQTGTYAETRKIVLVR